MLEVQVTLPTIVIFGDKTVAKKYDPAALTQLPKLRLGEGTLGTLFKIVLDCGSIIAMRMIRPGLVGDENLESWIKFFGGIHGRWLLPMHFSFWYGGEAFILYDYLCLGSLEDLLHGSEGMQFSPLSWRERKHIALSAAKAVAFLHTQVTKSGEALVCGVIKSSNILIRLDCSACLASYETPYIVSPATIIRRNIGRVAPELTTFNKKSSRLLFTQKSDVYSFGVLLLELITGQRPTMTDLGEYIIEKRKQEGLKGIYDKRLGEVKENMVELIGIARLCLSRNPQERPPMDRVVHMIQDLQDWD
ncbi:protein kinase domain-containing protein [Citrus sinensis]|nr:protein kinase domain-containing protein [Citrus sinensis]